MNYSARIVSQGGHLLCPYCNCMAIISPSSIIYKGKDYGNVWICSRWPDCDAYVGCHKADDKKNLPLGRLANSRLRQLKKQAHEIFDECWKSGRRKRNDAYIWIQNRMGLDKEFAHIGEFNEDQCLVLMELIQEEQSLYT